jgi:ABC-type lipoprotein export system ATPase subunit
VVLDCLAEFAAGGGTVLLVTHDAAAARSAHRVARMCSGNLEELPS